MKSGINQWVFPKNISSESAIEQAAAVGFESIELCVGTDGPIGLDCTEKEAAKLLRCADKAGIEILSVASGMGWDYPMTSPDPKIRKKAKESTTKTLQIAHWLGVDSILVVPGMVTPDVPYDVALENAINTIQDLLPTAEKLQVALAIENVWNKFLLSPTEMRDFIDQFESDGVCAFFDIGNILPYGYPEQWISILGARIKKLHAKDFRVQVGNLDGFVMLLEGDVNWPVVMAALKDIGYQGPLTAEFFPPADGPNALLQQCKAGLDTILALE
jgi:L-ribulose-5-phosphate 3-epimerase